MFKKQKLFLAIFSLAIAIRLVYLLITPPKQSPDEIYIFERSWYMATQNHQHPTHYPNNEYYYPPLYFFISSIIIKSLSIFNPPQLSVNAAYFRFYIPLRTLSFILSVSTLIFIWKIIERIKIENLLKYSVFAFIALLPSFASFSIFPNHNVLTLLFLTILVFIFSKDNFQFNNYKHAALSGFIFSLAILTKFDSIMIVPSIILLAISPITRRSINYLIIFTVFTLIFGGWWYISNLIKFGWFYDKSLFEAAISNFDKPFSVPGYTVYVIISAIQTFLATFGGYNQILLHPSAYSAFIIFISLSFYSSIKNRLVKHSLKLGRIYLFLLLMFLLNLTVFLQVNFIYVFQAQGRYLFPSIIFIGLTLSMGFAALFKPKYYIPFAIILLSGIILNLWGYLCIFNIFYNLHLPNINTCVNLLIR